MNDIVGAVVRELRGAREQDRRIGQIRVTTDALPGSVVTVPITPERARVRRQLAIDTDSGPVVIADPHYYERMLEMLMHPADEVDLLATTDGTTLAVDVGPPLRIAGILVVR